MLTGLVVEVNRNPLLPLLLNCCLILLTMVGLEGVVLNID